MTQLIAALCEGGKGVVTVSDRMVSTLDMTLTFEPEDMKARPITDRSVVLTAGTVHEPDLLIEATEKARGKERVTEIADVLKEIYATLRTRRIEDEILRPLVGIRTFAEYHQKQSGLHDSVVMDTNERIRRYDLGLTLVLAGIDDRGQGHVIVIGNPGTWRSFDFLGYCCQGIGDRHADNVFAWYGYTQSIALNEALYIAFEAKKKAQMAGGVGRATDILVLGRGKGIEVVSQETIRRLEAIYDERESRAQRRGFDNNITGLEIQTTALGTP